MAYIKSPPTSSPLSLPWHSFFDVWSDEMALLFLPRIWWLLPSCQFPMFIGMCVCSLLLGWKWSKTMAKPIYYVDHIRHLSIRNYLNCHSHSYNIYPSCNWSTTLFIVVFIRAQLGRLIYLYYSFVLIIYVTDVFFS